LQFGRTDGTSAQRLVQITNPYFEFVYKNTGVNNQREVVGMKIATLSGSMRIDAGAAGIVDSLNDAGGGKRWDGTCAGCTPLSQVGQLQKAVCPEGNGTVIDTLTFGLCGGGPEGMVNPFERAANIDFDMRSSFDPTVNVGVLWEPKPWFAFGLVYQRGARTTYTGWRGRAGSWACRRRRSTVCRTTACACWASWRPCSIRSRCCCRPIRPCATSATIRPIRTPP